MHSGRGFCFQRHFAARGGFLPVFPSFSQRERCIFCKFRILDLSNITLATYAMDGGEETLLKVMRVVGESDSVAELAIDVGQLATGRHSVVFRIRDAAGNLLTRARSFAVLRDQPSTVLVSDELTAADLYGLKAHIDPGTYTGLYTATCQINNRITAALIGGNLLSCQLDMSSLQDGTHKVRILLTADYGKGDDGISYEHIYENEVTVIKDTTAPEIMALTALADEYTEGPAIISFRISDAVSEVVSVTRQTDAGEELPLAGSGAERELSLSTHILATGTHELTLRATDTLGHTKVFRHVFLVLRDEPSLMRTSAEYTKEEHYQLTAEIDAGSWTGGYKIVCSLGDSQVIASIRNDVPVCPLDMSNLRDGTHAVRILLTADYGHGYQRSYEREITVIKDTTAPEIRAITELKDEYTEGPSVISFHITDAVSAVVSMTGQIDNGEESPLAGSSAEREISLPTHLLTTGAHALTLRATDALGHTQTFRQAFLVLRDEPSLARTSAEYTKEEHYQLTAEIDAGSWTGDYTAACSLGGSSVIASIRNNVLVCPLDMGKVRDGAHAVRVMLTADYGHGYRRSYAREVVVIKDTTEPEISVVTGLADEYTDGPIVVLFRIADAVSEVISMTRQTDDGEELPLAGSGEERELSVPTHLLATGAHELVLRATDTLGHTQTFRHAFLVLRDEPSLVRTSAGHTKEEHYQLTAEINAGSWTGGYTAVCSLGDSSVIASIQGNFLACPLDVGNRNDGAHAIRILLTADYGHGYRRSYEREMTIIKDTAAPEIHAITELKDEYTEGPAIISFRISDAVSEVVVVTRQTDDGEELPLAGTGAERELSVPTHLLATGAHALTLRASDTLGNIGIFPACVFGFARRADSCTDECRIHQRGILSTDGGN